MMVYLCRPIDKAKNAVVQYSEMQSRLRNAGFTGSFFVPVSAFSYALNPTPDLAHEDAKALVSINMGAIEQCDALLMEYVSGQETWGCPQEIAYAAASDVPVVILSRVKYLDLPMNIKGWVPPSMVVDTEKRAYQALVATTMEVMRDD